mgnify:FL=1
MVDVGAESLTIEVTGDSGKIDSLVELLKQYGVRVVMRTGKVAVLRGSLVAGEPDGAYHMRSVAGRVTPAELAGDDSGAV